MPVARHRLALLPLLFCGVVGAASAQGQEYARPTANPHQSASVALATGGMAASSHPLVTLTALDVLRNGGNAADAAIAANAVNGVVEPMSCGVGGDLFVLYWDQKSRTLHGLNASGSSPAALNRGVFEERELTEIPLTGPLPWSVPGCVDGWAMLHAKFGRAEWSELIAPAADLAERGFPVTEVIAAYWKASEPALSRFPTSANALLTDDGDAPAEGEVWRNPALAASLRVIAEQGADGFYRGPIAAEIVRFSEANDGFLSADDFADHRGEWVEPASTTYRGKRVYELPPNGQGIAALQMLNLLEPHDLRAMGRGAGWWHLFAEAKKLAFADRARFYADPAFSDVPVDALISKEYAAARQPLIDGHAAATDVPHGDPKLGRADTIYLTVVDEERNCCSLIQSNYYGFGSKVVPGDVGFALQNRGNLFSLDPDHPNALEPGKRPFHTIIPAMVTEPDGEDGERPWLCFGVMGGDMQPQGHVQILVNLLDFGLNLQAAGDAARIEHVGSQTPTGRPMDADGGTLVAEPTIPDEVVRDLRTRGHRVVRGRNGGGYQAVLIDWSAGENGVLHGATEPRKDGVALGY
ncbi:gamma-glutamyltransferase [Alienimonas sp. DA493]|uniref:gamma-glutamyltransferase n=1 Tax=Alienimonas sp. DA493 TaxID=3373605 RepID=UPI00375491A3